MAALSVVRIMNDVREFYKENPKGIYIVPEEEKISLVHALIIGTEGTPYENGFFYFVLKYVTFSPTVIVQLFLFISLGFQMTIHSIHRKWNYGPQVAGLFVSIRIFMLKEKYV